MFVKSPKTKNPIEFKKPRFRVAGLFLWMKFDLIKKHT